MRGTLELVVDCEPGREHLPSRSLRDAA